MVRAVFSSDTAGESIFNLLALCLQCANSSNRANLGLEAHPLFWNSVCSHRAPRGDIDKERYTLIASYGPNGQIPGKTSQTPVKFSRRVFGCHFTLRHDR
jgi:hypothetical protein